MGLEKIRMLWDIIETQIGNINTAQSYYQESIEHLKDYEYICNCCLNIFANCSTLHKSSYYSDKQVGEQAHNYLLELKEYIDNILEVQDE